MFENLASKIERAFKVLKGSGSITEINVAETLKEVRKALLDADVHYMIAKKFCDRVREKAIGQKVLTSVSPGQLMIKITRDEMAELMGSQATEINLSGNPTVILAAGLQGSGKTTFCGKLALHLREKKGKNPLLVACDIYRPAAIDQLHVIGQQTTTEVYSERENKNVVQIAERAISHAKSSAKNVVIIDTAGRLHVDEVMMKEVAAIKKAVQPQEILFVVDSMTGQDAVNTAKVFHDLLDYNGVVLTKLDGDTRGGAALTIKAVVDKPIKFISNGEKPEALDIFHPERIADRILGMGDVVTLVERAQEQFNLEEARMIQKKIARDKFNFDDFLSQIKQIKKMGNVKDLIGMIPGAGKMMGDTDIDEKSFASIEVIISSMTPAERATPDLINGSRRKRIAMGSGRSAEEVNNLMRKFDQMRKMMKMMQKGQTIQNALNNFHGARKTDILRKTKKERKWGI